jgi:AcrR family transcriptional regulator
VTGPARTDGDGRSSSPARSRDLRARGQQTLERLLDAGATVFAARGYHAARVDDIVKQARTSHGTFYLYFASKEDLFRALALDVTESMVELARSLPPLTADDTGPLSEWLEHFQQLYERNVAVIRTWTEAEMVASEMGHVGGELVAQFSDRVASRIREAAPELDPVIAGLALVAMIERSTYYLMTRQLPVDPAELVVTLASVIQAGLHGGVAGG